MYGVSSYGDYGNDYGAAKKKRWKSENLEGQVDRMKKLAKHFTKRAGQAKDRNHPKHAEAFTKLAAIATAEADRLDENKGKLSGDLGGIADTVTGSPWIMLALGLGGGFLLAGLGKRR